MKNTKKLVLVHSDMKKNTTSYSEDINLLLTPQFYTVKREAIPVKYAYEAKRIAPSLFEGLLENLHSHKYFVSKEEDTWLFIAYDEDKIKTFLESKDIDTQNISKIYFAEQSAEYFTAPVLLGNTEALVNLGGNMTIVPQIALNEEERAISISNIFTPKKGVTLEGRGKSFLSTNESYTIAAIFVLFSIIYFVEGSRYGGDEDVQQEEMRLLLEDYPSLQSSYKRESIADKYRKIDSKERRKRDVIKSLSQMIFKGSTLTNLTINDKKFQAQFTCENQTIVDRVKELAKKQKFNTRNDTKSNTLKIEGTL